jgi:hypothetical protein
MRVALNDGDVTVASDGNLTIGNSTLPLTYNSANTLTLASGGDLTINSSFQNQGAGAINLIAGWQNSGATALAAPTMAGAHGAAPALGTICLPDYQPITINVATVCDDFGVAAGTLFIGDGSQVAAVTVGSRQGETNALAGTVSVNGGTGSGTSAQLGFKGDGSGDITGDINVFSGAGGASVTGGTGLNSEAQIGHGGRGSTTVNIDADINLSFCETADLTIAGNTGVGNFAQIGHGGQGFNGSTLGDISTTGTVLSATIAGGDGNLSYAQLGHGGLQANGEKGGDITLVAETVTISGGAGGNSSGKIGHGGATGTGQVSGEISVTSTVGDISASAGSGAGALTQIGHGGNNFFGSVTAQPITVNSANNVIVRGGGGAQAVSMIGHGGVNAQGTEFSGDVDVTSVNDIGVLGGVGAGSYAQIGSGGSSADASIGGDITVDAGRHVTMTAPNQTGGAYSQIGNGDNLKGGFAPLSGTGAREGDIEVSASSNITLTESFIGHVNGENTNAGPASGTTSIGAARDNPTDPTAGTVRTDGPGSGFAGPDGLYFYMPRRENNQVAPGTILNGWTDWTGGQSDPSPTQRIDEFTINIIGDIILFPNEHGNQFGTGPAPHSDTAGFAFNFDTIVLAALPPAPPLLPVLPVTPLPVAPLLDTLFPDDRTTDDWQREQEGIYTGFNLWGVYYEGFDQYGRSGDSIFSTEFGNTLELDPGFTEDLLERQLRILEEVEEEEEENEEEGAE